MVGSAAISDNVFVIVIRDPCYSAMPKGSNSLLYIQVSSLLALHCRVPSMARSNRKQTFNIHTVDVIFVHLIIVGPLFSGP